MMRYLAIGAAIFATGAAHSQTELYLCDDGHGTRTYQNSGASKGCKRVDLPGITSEPKITKPKKPRDFPAGVPVIGMTPEEAGITVGAPIDIKKIETRKGRSQIWTYHHGLRLTFVNGSLEIIQE